MPRKTMKPPPETGKRPQSFFTEYTDPSPTSDEPALHCGRCDSSVPPRVTVRVFADDTEHLEARCADCGGWLQWLPQVEPWLSLVTQPPRYEQGALL